MFRWISFLVATLVAGVVIGQSVTWQKPWHTRTTSAQFYDAGNSTSTALAGDATWTGTATLNCCYTGLVISVLTDANGTLYVEQSPDGTNWDSSISYIVSSGTHEVHQLEILKKYARVKFTNDSVAQTYMRLQTKWGDHGKLTIGLGRTMQQDGDAIITRGIPGGLEIAQNHVQDYSNVFKYGYNPAISTTLEHIWDVGGTLTWATSAESLELVSSDGDDTAAGSGCQAVTVYGLDSAWALQQEEVEMAGASDADLANTYIRIYRMECTRRGTYNAANEGTITLRVNGAGATRAQIAFDSTEGGLGGTEMTHYTIPAGYKGYLVGFRINVEASKPINFFGKIRTNADDTSDPISSVRKAIITLRNIDDTQVRVLEYPVLLPEKTDLWGEAYATGATTGYVSLDYQIILIKDL